MQNQKKSPKDKIALATIFSLIYVVWILLVAGNTSFIQKFDQTIVNIITNYNPANIAFARKFTNFGSTLSISLVTVILFVILMVFKKYAYAYFTAGVMIAANGFNWILKHIVKRPRPSVHHLVYADGFSFPSGHSVGSAALCAVLIVLIILMVKPKFLKTILIILAVLFPLVIGYTRMFLHVHYPSDVVGGWLGGITFGLIGYSFLYHFYLETKIKE